MAQRKKRKLHKRKNSFVKLFLMAMAVMAVSAAAVSGTFAYISTKPDSVTNRFEAAQVSCKIQENFSDGVNKKDVTVLNTSDTAVFIRVKLLPYWYAKDSDNIVAKKAWEPVFESESGWILGSDGFYYYTEPVGPGEYTAKLIKQVTLEQDPVSLARPVLEMIASCIQATPDDAVMAAWTGTNGSVTGVSSGKLQVN